MERKISQNQAVSILNEVEEAEMSGDYSRGYQLLSVFWNDFRTKPNTADLSDELVAEVFLRCGSISGYLGRSRKISNAQDVSRELLFEAKLKFIKLDSEIKIAECDNYLALTFERTGEIEKARDFLNNAFSRDVPFSHPTRLHSHVIDALLNLAEKNYQIIYQNSLMLESHFQHCPNKTFQGCFYNNYGLALKNLGRTDEALDKFLTARLCFFEAGHHQYCGLLENNIARLYTANVQFKEAHNFAQKAENTFKLVGDFCRQGYALDTRANIFLAEGKYENALEFAEKGIKLLQNAENMLFLLNTYKTKIKSLIHLKKFPEADQTFEKAKTIAEQVDSSTLSDFTNEIEILLANYKRQIKSK